MNSFFKYLGLFVFIFCSYCNSHAAQLNNIQRGTAVVGTTETSKLVAITGVDLTKSILIFTVRSSSNTPRQAMFAGYLSATDTITFQRFRDGTLVTIEWAVYEFTSGVNVQRGTVSSSPVAGSNVALSAVTVAESFAIVTVEKEGAQLGLDDAVTGEITSPTNLFLAAESGLAPVVDLVAWQVVEWAGANVEKVVDTLSAGVDSSTYTLTTPVNRNKAMVIGNHRISAATVNADDMPGTELIDGNTVQFSRVGTTGDMYFVVYVVEFTDSTDVIHGQIRMTSADTTVSTTICDVFSLDSAGVWPSGHTNQSGNNCMTTDDHFGYFWPTYNLTNSTTVQCSRTDSGAAALFPFQILEFSAATPAGCSDPEPGISTPRTANLCTITILPIELLNFNAHLSSDNNVSLDWQTASEINNDYFTVERSKDGINWEAIIRVEGSGNSNTLLNYESIDSGPYKGVSYYRLKQTDFDGQFSYSKIRSVEIGEQPSSALEIYPNPTENELTISGEELELKEVKIINVLGQDVSFLTKTIINSRSKLVLNLSDLTTGMYYIKTKTTANKVYKK